MPPASLKSWNAISTDLAPAWPYSPAGPVSSMTRPMVMSQSAASAGKAEAPSAVSTDVARSNLFIDVLPFWFGRLPAATGFISILSSAVLLRLRSGCSFVEIVFHDRAVTAAAITLQRVDVAFELLCVDHHGSDFGVVLGGQPYVGNREIGLEVRAVAGSHDDSGNPGSGQHRGAGDRCDVGAIAV